MRKIAALSMVVFSLIAVLVFAVVSVSAQSTMTDFVSEESLAPIGPPGRVWVSDDGIQHLRDFPVAGPVWGDLNGTLTVHANINWDLATGDGTAYGTAVLDAEWNGKTGTFEGRSQWKYTGFGVSDGQFVGHGTGDFAGMHMQANFYDNDWGTTSLVGTIHNPHGG